MRRKRNKEKVIYRTISEFVGEKQFSEKALCMAERKLGLALPEPGSPYSSFRGRAKVVYASLIKISSKKELRVARDRKKRITGEERQFPPSMARLRAFFVTNAWRKIRMETFDRLGNSCLCCGMGPPHVPVHVAHVKPIRNYWHLRLDPANLQVLCEDCNLGTGSRLEKDYRQSPPRLKIIKGGLSDA